MGRYKKHGLSKTLVYRRWADMLNRCKNPNFTTYKYYGGRGIKVCERWLNFENFLQDMGVPTDVKNSIDRIDNNKGYSPDNCRWVSKHEQIKNRRNNVQITYLGKTQTVNAWAKEFNIPNSTIHYRIENGQTGERLFRKRSEMYILYKLRREEVKLLNELEHYLRTIAKELADNKIDDILAEIDKLRKQAAKDSNHL